MDQPKYLFDEKQFLGLNKFSILRRMVLSIFCFLIYYYSREENDAKINVPPQSGEFMFYMGIIILAVSVLLVFVLHLQTRVIQNAIILEGLWTARKVKIDLKGIVEVKKITYSRYFFNRPVYNLNLKKRIRFYTRGKDAIELTDRDGLVYVIGSQRAEELLRVLESQVKTNDS